jgi:hypothetical protein
MITKFGNLMITARPCLLSYRHDPGVSLSRPAQEPSHDNAKAVLYDLWEYWQQRAALTMNQADERVRSDVDGETAAALVHARGAKTHVLEEFGHLTDTYGDTYRAYYGVWRWQGYSDPRARFATRDGWYARHVAREEVLPPLEAALRWMSVQPELQ